MSGCWREGDGDHLTKILVYGGWFGSGNTGDDAILIGLRELLTETLPDAEIIALSTDPQQTRRVCGVDAHPLRSPRQLLAPPWREIRQYTRLFREADACILSGGTPIYDHDHLSRAIHCGLPLALRRKLICFGIGVKPISSRRGRSAVKALLGRTASISTRDPDSKLCLRAIGIEGEIQVTGDSALLLRERRPPPQALARINSEEERLRVAVCPRALSPEHKHHYHAPLSETEIRGIRRTLAEAADRLSQAGHLILFIPLHKNHGEDDTVEISRIKSRMREPSVVIDERLSPEGVAGLLGEMEAVIGMRLHSLILAAARGVPVVSVDYDPKIQGFMEYAGISEYLFRIDEKAEVLVRGVERGMEDRKGLETKLLRSCSEMRRKMREEALRIRELLS